MPHPQVPRLGLEFSTPALNLARALGPALPAIGNKNMGTSANHLPLADRGILARASRTPEASFSLEKGLINIA